VKRWNAAPHPHSLDAPGPVVLDATAREDFIYKLMEDRAVIIPTPQGVRDYGRVTLHVAWARSGTGKSVMIEKAKTRFPRLIEDLTQRLTPERSAFFCVHKAVKHELPEAADLPFAKVAKAHWGAVDGSNEYADCDVAVIFGLPFRDALTCPPMSSLRSEASMETIGWTTRPGTVR
jgi:hypothetical protein